MNNSIIKNQRIFNSLSEFFYSKYYPVYLALFTVFFYTAKIPMAGLVFYALLSAITLIRFRDLTPFMPLPMMIMMSFSDLVFFGNALSIICMAILFISLVLHLLLYPIKKFKFGKLFFPIIFVSVALFCGGLFSPYLSTYANGLGSSLSVGLMIFIFYLLFTNYNSTDTKINYKNHFMYLLAVCGALISLELIIHQYNTTFDASIKYEMGYGNTNIVAAALLVTLPSYCYFICKNKNTVFCFVMLILCYLGIYLSHSDGALAVSLAFAPILALIIYFNADKRKKVFYIKAVLIASAIAIVCLILIATKRDLYAILLKYLDKVKTDNLRTGIYLHALDLFSKYPVFGVGLGYFAPGLNNPEETGHVISYLFSFHSTFFHVIATMGILGIIAYVIYYIARYKIILSKSTLLNLTCYISFSMMQVYGSIDGCEFHAFPILIYCTFMFIILEKHNKEKDNDLPLPLTKKILNYKTFN